MEAMFPGLDLCAFPAGIPPEGQVPNFVNPTTLAPVTIALCSVLTALAVIFATARMYVNWRKLKLSDCQSPRLFSLSTLSESLVLPATDE